MYTLIIHYKRILEMRPKKTNKIEGSWYNQFNPDVDQANEWLDVYRRHLSWIRSSENDELENLLKDYASEL